MESQTVSAAVTSVPERGPVALRLLEGSMVDVFCPATRCSSLSETPLLLTKDIRYNEDASTTERFDGLPRPRLVFTVDNA